MSPAGGDVAPVLITPFIQRDRDRLEMTLTGTDPDLTTVIVNWNTVGLLDDCLQSLVDHLPPGVTNEVIVVDNASADGSVEHLAREWPWVKVIANTENVGFCRANNQAIRASTGEIAPADQHRRPGHARMHRGDARLLRA